MQLPYVEIDKIFWGPGWSMPADKVFFEKLETALSADAWVLDGNYTRTTLIKWKDVQTVIWLDYSFWVVFSRAIKRALVRAITRQELWEGTGNRESFKNLFGRDSIVWWTLKTFYPNRAKYNKCMTDINYNHIRFIKLSSPGEAQRLLGNI